jgi:tetratricopeptide (TPR) repeat protein
MIFLKRGLVDLAREKFLKIIDNQPVGKSNLEPYYFLALCHGHAGEAEKAKAIFAKILAEDYNFRDVRKRLAG